jgi:phage nucleotide-binding protein
MNISKINVGNLPFTAMLYCKPGVGKSTAIGLIAERSEGNTLVLDVDRTIQRTLAKGEVVKDISKVYVQEIENRGKIEKDGRVLCEGTFAAWTNTLQEITKEFLEKNNITTVAVDNISELERCILSDLGAQGKNKGVPAMADYQYMQFKLVNSLRYMKSWGVNIVWTAWETAEQFTHPDGTQYTRLMPKISAKIVDNICGLCDIVGWIAVNKDGEHHILLEATQNIYAKNQIDARKSCKVEEFYQKKEAKNEKNKS